MIRGWFEGGIRTGRGVQTSTRGVRPKERLAKQITWGPLMRNSYEEFFQLFPKEKFFQFGLDNVLFAEKSVSDVEWKSLLQRIEQKDPNLFVRSAGRQGKSNAVLADLYQDIFGIKIRFDGTNNAKPASVIQRLKNLKKNKEIANYQVSHVFGRTKNVYCFTAPWNVVFIPKIVDPLTGHEAKGEFVKEFQKLFKEKIMRIYYDQILEYNAHMAKYSDRIADWVSRQVKQSSLGDSINESFSSIDIGQLT